MAYNSTLVGTATPGASGSVSGSASGSTTGSKDPYIDFKFDRDQNIGVNGLGYYPNVYVKTNLYTDGDKAQPVLYLSTTGEIYKGPYYLVATGDRYTGTFPNSNPNSPVKNSLPQVESDIILYETLPKPISVTRGADPKPYKPVPNHIDYVQNIMFRHFAKKANDNVFMEIGASTYQLIIDQDPSINYTDWEARRISWRISSIDPYDVYAENKTRIYRLDTGTYDITKDEPIDLSGGITTPGASTQFRWYPDPPGVIIEPIDSGAEREIDNDKLKDPQLFTDPWPGFKEWFTKNQFYPYFWKFRNVSNRNEGPSSTYTTYGSTLSWDIIWSPNTKTETNNVPASGFLASNLPPDFKYFTEYWVDLFNPYSFAALTKAGSSTINPAIPIWKPLTNPTNIRNSKKFGKIGDHERYYSNNGYLTALTNNTISISKKNTYANITRGDENIIRLERYRISQGAGKPGLNTPYYYPYYRLLGSKFYFIHDKPFAGATKYSTETALIFQSTDQDRFVYAKQNPPTQVYKGPFFRTTIFAIGNVESLKYEFYSGNVPAYMLEQALSFHNPASGVAKTESLLEAPKTEDDPTKDYNTVNTAGVKTVYKGFYHSWKKPDGSTEYYTGIINTPTSQRLYITPKSTTP